NSQTGTGQVGEGVTVEGKGVTGLHGQAAVQGSQAGDGESTAEGRAAANRDSDGIRGTGSGGDVTAGGKRDGVTIANGLRRTAGTSQGQAGNPHPIARTVIPGNGGGAAHQTLTVGAARQTRGVGSIAEEEITLCGKAGE